jgi:hypothetical protein
MFARDFACEARLAGDHASPGDDLRALRSLSVAARRALYEHAIRTALEPSPEADDAAVLAAGADPVVGLRLVRFLRAWVARGPDGPEG